MYEKLLVAIMFLLMVLPARCVSAESGSGKQAEKAFGEFKKALKKEDYGKAWDSCSRRYRDSMFDRNYDVFRKSYDKEIRKMYGNLKVVEARSMQNNVILVTKPGGLFGRFKKARYHVECIVEDGAWKINDIGRTVFSRTPRKGYRPEDLSGLDDKTRSEIEAVRELCETYSNSLSELDLRTAWECLIKDRKPYKKFLKFGYVRGIEKNESKRKYWASQSILDIKIENDVATADFGRNNESNKIVFMLTKEENRWKIITWYDTTSLSFDEDKLPPFYFEHDGNRE